MAIQAWWEGGWALILAKPGMGGGSCQQEMGKKVTRGWQWGQGPLWGPSTLSTSGGKLLTDEGVRAAIDPPKPPQSGTEAVL